MNFLTLEQIKQQLRIEPDFTLEDDLLTLYGESAEQTLAETISRTYEELLDEYGAVPVPLIQAALLLVGSSYQHREPVSAQNKSIIPYAFDIMVKPYMRLADREACGEVVQAVPIGSDAKILISELSLPDELTIYDVDFTGKVVNMSRKDVETDFTKADCIETDEGYVVLVDTDSMGIGVLMLRLVVLIPDTDYPSGTRREVVKINPHVRITG